MWDKTPGMYCFARAGWNNQQVTKNCGVLPFLFHQMYGWRAVMAGPRIEADYPGLAYVPGLEMDFLADARTESALAYLEAHQMDIDVLVFHGVFPNYIPLAARYKELRPDGKIYLELDANAFYEDQLEWTKPEAMAFLQSCDVIGASCHAMQRHIGQKWPVVVEYLPNGFYDFTGSSQPMQAQNFFNMYLNNPHTTAYNRKPAPVTEETITLRLRDGTLSFTGVEGGQAVNICWRTDVETQYYTVHNRQMRFLQMIIFFNTCRREAGTG